jgi:hypothetical protein
MAVSGAIATVTATGGQANFGMANHEFVPRQWVLVRGTSAALSLDGLHRIVSLPGATAMIAQADYSGGPVVPAASTWQISKGLRGRTRGRLRTQI